ncbi:hypothetical protein [Thalassorhabdomicrobium marinisediminis]|uniref:hypothetical protein n=1 Tax=Thalassorhabdomicrobium marinisediminis TaxID=2170577 RepID=UPI002490AE72|nr:hypothetical protein [Thalassorhabdomicrobium marinisediminis]
MKKILPTAALALVCATSAARADNLTTPGGDVVMIEKQQVQSTAGLSEGLTVGQLFINVGVAAIVALALSSDGGT